MDVYPQADATTWTFSQSRHGIATSGNPHRSTFSFKKDRYLLPSFHLARLYSQPEPGDFSGYKKLFREEHLYPVPASKAMSLRADQRPIRRRSKHLKTESSTGLRSSSPNVASQQTKVLARQRGREETDESLGQPQALFRHNFTVMALLH